MTWLNPHSDPTAATRGLGHDMAARFTRDDLSRQGFVTAARAHMYGVLPPTIKTTYQRKVAPEFRRTQKRIPKIEFEIHRTLKHAAILKF